MLPLPSLSALLLPVLPRDAEPVSTPRPHHFARAQNNDTAGGIHWVECGPALKNQSTVPLYCAELPVPLDYTAPNSTAVHTLELIKVEATKQPANGSILLNYGGPGAEGLVNLASTATLMLNITGGTHDLISFNPRGTSGKYLSFSCYQGDIDRVLATVLDGLFDGAHMDASDTQAGRKWAAAKTFADTCNSNSREIGQLVGTAFVARDMMRIVDALGQGPLLNYYGLSYGTVLGATVAAMFPDRMGRVAIDGVLNPHEYYNLAIDKEWLSGTDFSFRQVLIACVEAGPSKCALASQANGTVTAPELEKAIYDFIDRLKFRPLPLPLRFVNYLRTPASLLDYSALKTLIFQTLYTPVRFPVMAAALDELLRWGAALDSNLAGATAEPDLRNFAEWRERGYSDFSGATVNEALTGIRCGDKNPAVRTGIRTLEDIMPAVNGAAAYSRLVGNGSLHSSITLPCARWSIGPARERYDGDFRVRTRNPMLIVSATWDPITPLVSAENVTATFEGSILLERKGFGHSSIAMSSACSERAIGAYFSEGILPETGTICDHDSPVF